MLKKNIYFTKNESGTIFLPFIILLPFIIGLFFLSFEISRFIQKKAKLSDAIEQATLALTVENDSHNPNEVQTARNAALITSYANAYLPSETFSMPKIEIIPHLAHLEYRATTTLSYAPQFLTKNPITNTDKNIRMSDNAIAKKSIFIGPTEKTDVVFVVDYSSSMEDSFVGDSHNKSKINYLREIFNKLNDTILKNNDIGIIGFIPFSWGTKKITDNKNQANTFCHFPFVPRINNSIDKDIKAHNEIRKATDISHSPIQRIIEDNIDLDATIKSITDENKMIDINMDDIFYDSICLKGSDAYLLKSVHNNKELIEDMIIMKPYGATLVSAGILAGNKILKESDSKKLMIILSDGEDTYLSKNISKELINKGMCEKIKENDTIMVFIKIGYKSSNINWKKCVGSGNYYEAHNAYQLEADLMQALGATEIREVGRNTPKN